MPIDGSSGGLINIGELSKPATTFIEKISDAVGGIAKPWHLVRVAKAEARADLIKSQSKIEISELEHRALQRMVREEGKKQENIESITAQAIPLLSENAKPENIEDDWITHIFDRCSLVSDTGMQTLWANILAGEANSPSTFSKRTIDLVATLDKADAELFIKLCSFVWMIGLPTVLIMDVESEQYTKAGIDFASLSHLDSIGLIRFEPTAGFRKLRFPKSIIVFYYSRPIVIDFPNTENDLQIGKALFTRAGLDLLRVCTTQPSEKHFTYILDGWLKQNYILSSPIDAATLRMPL